jgi:hypothetical protein
MICWISPLPATDPTGEGDGVAVELTLKFLKVPLLTIKMKTIKPTTMMIPTTGIFCFAVLTFLR